VLQTGSRRSRKRDRQQAQLALRSVDAGELEHPVPEAEQVCTHCGEDADFRPVGPGRASELYDYVPGYFRRSRHIVHSVACRCGKTIVSAKGPQRATARSKYGPGLAALCVTHKCVLGMPIHRIEKLLRGHGTPVSRSTLNELFLRVGEKLAPIADALLEQVRAASLVLADETPIKLTSHDKQAWMWVFIGGDAVVFVFDRSRAGAIPKAAIGGTTGVLLTDGYAGYNTVTGEEGRDSARCHSHIRRGFYEARASAPEVDDVLALYREIFELEAQVRAAGLAGSAEHLQVRRKRMGALFGQIRKWMRRTAGTVSPKSALHKAIEYAEGQWRAAMRCLYDPSIPLTNNLSERTARIVAVGRKNFYGVQSLEGGRALAVLYSLTASCEAAGIDPFAYVRDVISRIEREDPRSLVPSRWAARTDA
jgi:transposase